MQFGTPEILLIVLAIVLLFGASRLPQIARSIGQSRKAFKEGMREAEEAERPENKPSQIESKTTPLDVASMSDDEIMAEMRRRVSPK